jgi:homogentisate 1,2-dioxygenase
MQPTAADTLGYLHGFGNQFESEAIAGALPVGMNSPKKTPFGLYGEQISGTSFTSTRSENRRTWVYRTRPMVSNEPWAAFPLDHWLTAPLAHGVYDPRPLRWQPLSPAKEADFLSGIRTVGAHGDAAALTGCAIHVYAFNRSMGDQAICSADGEILIVPESGALEVQTELGWLSLRPGEIALIPRGLCYRVLLDQGRDQGPARGYILENYGPLLRLPELGPIGANGLANARDFCCPKAAFESDDRGFEIVTKFAGKFWSRRAANPFNVVAWHGNHVPLKYELSRFNIFGATTYDSPDPSVSTLLTSPSPQPGTANIDFVIFPPRWQVAEKSFRPPFFHRNVMTEFMGNIYGEYEGKIGGFVPGGFSLHSCMTPHGPDRATYQRGITEPDTPNKLAGTMAFMFETRLPLALNRDALHWPELEASYTTCWSGFEAAAIEYPGQSIGQTTGPVK